MTQPVLRLSGITKRFGPVLANDRISLTLMPGEVVALLGENGAGKTTLMNILFGHYVADEGTVEAFGRSLPPGEPGAALKAGIGMVHQNFTLAENMTVEENILLGTQPLWRPALDRRGARAKIARIAEDFGLALEPGRQVAALSVGERQRVEIAKALYRGARVLILDEPTAVLTPGEAEALFRTLRRLVGTGLAVIFISHKLGEVLAASDRVVVLRGGRVAGERPTAGATRAELAAMMVGAAVAAPVPREAKPGPVRFALADVSTLARDCAPKDALRGVGLELAAGTITGLAGVSGNGQAALAGLVAGTERPASGAILLDGRNVADWSPRMAIAAGIGRIPEDRHAAGTIGDMTVAENTVLERYRAGLGPLGFVDWRAARAFAEAIIRDYDVKCPSTDAPIRLLSGGNMQKLILGRALDGAPPVILANQPTRGLDIGAVAYVHARLLEARERGAAILLISEDLDEVMQLSDRIVVISQGRLSAASARGERTVAELGALMAGHGFEGGLEGGAHAA